MTYQTLREDDDSLSSSEPPSTADIAATEITAPGLVPATVSDDFVKAANRSANSSQGWLGGPRGLLLGLLLGLGLAVVGTRISSQTAAEPATTPPENAQVATATVTTAQSETAPVRQTITTNGTVEAFDLLSVAPRASGLQIQSVNVREGDRVDAGQVLAVLDDSVLRSEIAQSDAQVTQAEAAVAQAKAQAAQAEAELTEAEENFDRYDSLFSQGAISAEALTSRRTEVATKNQAVQAAYAAVQSAEATVLSRRAEVTRSTTQLDQTLVLAPSSGIIATKDATVGDTASTGTPLFTLIDGDQLELAVKVPQAQLAQINVGTSVQIRSSSDPNLQLQGQVRTVDPTIDATTRQATVKIGLPGSDRIRPGMFLQAAIVTNTRDGVVVPAEAVLPQSDGTFVVYTLNSDRTVKANAVDIGDRIPATDDAPAKIEITLGLDDNVAVVVEGASYLQNGDLVDIASQENS
ncbi:MAG: efflux RND transporter periplasmic adaptor subunit [Cyanobacteria bacterium J06598_1]